MKKPKNNLFSLFAVLLVSVALTFSGLAVLAQPEPAEDILEEAPKKDDYPDSDAVFMLDKGVVEVNEEGEKSVTTSIRIKVFNKEGRQSFGEVEIPYIDGSGKPEMNYVRTITPDGEVIEPEEEDIKDVTPAKLQDYPMYSDVKNRVVSMPGLTNGSIIDYSYTLTPKRHFMQEEFSSNWAFQTGQPVVKSHYEVSFPSEMDVEWADFGADLEPSVEEADNRKTLTWERSDIPRIIEEPAMPPMQEVTDRVLVTSIDSWDKYAREFWKLAEDRVQPNEDIRAKTEELTEGLETDEEKIHAIYNYAATKIRYVAIELGRGRIQPHDATEVFQNKYGDCKDKAALMISMLDVVGIDAHPVLILSGLNRKTDFEEPPPARGLNHAIVAVETDDGLELMDPTCDVCPNGYLPDEDRGKKALVVLSEDGGAKRIVDTDRFNPESSVIQIDQEVKVDGSGNMESTVNLSHDGSSSYSLKQMLESYPEARRKQIYRGVLSQLEPGAILEDFEHSDLEDIDKKLELSLSYNKNGFANTVNDSLTFQTPPTLRIPLSLDFDQSVSLTPEERQYPIQLLPATYVQQTKIKVPEGSEISTPDGVEVETEWAEYNSSYEVEGERIHVTREFVKKEPEVPVEGYPEYQELIQEMSSDRNAQFQVKE